MTMIGMAISVVDVVVLRIVMVRIGRVGTLRGLSFRRFSRGLFDPNT